MLVNDVQTYLTIRQLDRTNAPGIVIREGVDRHVVWEPTARRIDLVGWMLDTLEPEETEAICAAYGVGFPLPDWTVSDEPLMLYVPPALRLPGAHALQGGIEVYRRRKAGRATMELHAVRAEIVGARSIDYQRFHDLAQAI